MRRSSSHDLKKPMMDLAMEHMRMRMHKLTKSSSRWISSR